MNEQPRWTLHYDDGSTFSAHDGEPNDSPALGVVFVTQPYAESADIVGDGAKALLFRADRGEWMPVFDSFGLMDQLAHHAPNIVCVRPGRQMWTPDFKRLATKAAREMRGR